MKHITCRDTASRVLVILFIALILAVPAFAQTVTDDDVNAVAKQLYCPVCENIPLDACGTSACIQWRDEIRSQLEQGQTEEQIVQRFVAQFGERVVGTPQDPTLRMLALVTPYLVGIVALVIAGRSFSRWRGSQADMLSDVLPTAPASTHSDDEYRARLERDLLERR